jgi:hypothetical protein
MRKQHIRQSDFIIVGLKAAGKYKEGDSEIDVGRYLGGIKRAEIDMRAEHFDSAIEELSKVVEIAESKLGPSEKVIANGLAIEANLITSVCAFADSDPGLADTYYRAARRIFIDNLLRGSNGIEIPASLDPL